MSDTIFALSSGAPPAAIGVIRISGVEARTTLRALSGRDIEARRPSLVKLRDSNGHLLDEALAISFPGPNNATGEDLVELHCHGGRAVIAAIEQALGGLPGLRPAEPGEFTRRAFVNGQMDLAEAEGLADLLTAETELQRSAAVAMAGGSFSAIVADWRDRLLGLSAQVEAALDFSDEDDVEELPAGFKASLSDLSAELGGWLAKPRAERLAEGYRVVLAGPPNAGKSTLFNALTESEAAITSPIEGTTRDVIERTVAIGGVPLCFVDTAGLRAQSSDEIELIGIAKAQAELVRADLVLWLGPKGEGPDGAWDIAAKADLQDHDEKGDGALSVSATNGDGLDELRGLLVESARAALPKPGEAALNARQAGLIAEAHNALQSAVTSKDWLLLAEDLRRARVSFDRLIGRSATEDMLDALFGRFCIGK